MAGPGGKIKKAQYYVWYLGWKECRGVYGREHTEPIAKELIHRRHHEILPKLTIEVSKKELKIVQLVEKRKGGGKGGAPGGKVDRIGYPSVPAKDVTYAVQVLSPDEDVVACIYLGYNPQTGCGVHVHVYRCDSAETGALFVAHLNRLIDLPEHRRRVEKIEAQLAAKGQVVPRPRNISDPNDFDTLSTLTPDTDDGNTYESRSNLSDPLTDISPGGFQARPNENPYGRQQNPYQSQQPPNQQTPPAHQPQHTPVPQYHQQNHQQQTSGREHNQNNQHLHEMFNKPNDIYNNLTLELKDKLGVKKKPHIGADNLPLLLPPKDYDTIHRSAGNLENINSRRSKTANIVKVPTGGSSNHSGGSGDKAGSGGGLYSRGDRVPRDEGPPGYGNSYNIDRKESFEKKDPEGLKHVTPHWKSHGSYQPPHPSNGGAINEQSNPITQQRPTSPVRMGPYGRKERPLSPTRARSPGPMMGPPGGGRPMSPPPDLRGESYFQGSDPLPGYLPGSHPKPPTGHYGSNPRPNHHDRGQQDYYGSNGGDIDPVYSGGKKYTASTLGLLERGNGKHRHKHSGPPSGRSDERQNPYADYSSLDRGRPGYQSRPGHMEGPGYDPRGQYGPHGPGDQGSNPYGPGHSKHNKHHDLYQSDFKPYNEVNPPTVSPDYSLGGLGYYP